MFITASARCREGRAWEGGREGGRKGRRLGREGRREETKAEGGPRIWTPCPDVQEIIFQTP